MYSDGIMNMPCDGMKWYLAYVGDDRVRVSSDTRVRIKRMTTNVYSIRHGQLCRNKRDVYDGYVLVGVNDSSALHDVYGVDFVSVTPLSRRAMDELCAQMMMERTEIEWVGEYGDGIMIRDDAESWYAGMTGIYLGLVVDDNGFMAAVRIDDECGGSRDVYVPIDYLIFT